MQDLQNLEKFEIEVLQLLNSVKILEHLYFGGGTMLRLCHNLKRYSTDLDFWLGTEHDSKLLYRKLKVCLESKYSIIDAANKRNTLLFQFRSDFSIRTLKVEVRKNQSDFEWEKKIAFSRYSNIQVQVKGLTLEQMMRNKIDALLSRKIIRDAFDIQFILMRGIQLPDSKTKLEQIKNIVLDFKTSDFKVTLGSILPQKEREFYVEHKFNFLIEEITAKLLILSQQ